MKFYKCVQTTIEWLESVLKEKQHIKVSFTKEKGFEDE